ncbi:VOC family protein [Rhodospirillum centenum]|uniref:Glyoxalase family protein n=1 Tax=Rhodospirillum centenum (strain ATCC 51521 / SW) TaxID=414684 RepID=B6IXE9_RHOCS|nr:VOC family protein [Rhodospirillum centenum]ACJ00973.1 glyoxalase family protein [Rhodospirillum centenum SW]
MTTTTEPAAGTANDSAAAMPPFGSFVWQELMTPNPAKARTFFGDLLGWSFREVDMGEHGLYTIISHGGRDVGGMMKMDGSTWDGIPPHWMTYVNVADVDAACAKVTDLGGKVCVPPFDVTGVGRIAVINDPTGAVISLITFAMPDAA